MKRDAKVYHSTNYPMQLGSYKPNLRNFCGHIHAAAAQYPNSLNVGVDLVELRSLGLKFWEPVSKISIV